MKIFLKIDRDIATCNFIASVYLETDFIVKLIDTRFNAYPNWFKKHIKETHFKSELMSCDGASYAVYYDCIFK